MPQSLNKNKGQILKNTKKAFTLTEIIVTVSIFFIIAGVGLGAYFEYFNASLIKTDLSNTFELIKNTRFKALKNPTNSNYGIHIDSISGTFTSFCDTYNPLAPENVTFQLEKLVITDLSLNPVIASTNEIIFEAQTGKTQNYGSLTLEINNFSNIININLQGVVE